jgi:hypothetical protein
MPKFDNLPQFFEELKLKEETTLTFQDLINQFKQQIPANFICLEIKEKNYQCSTTGWKEPVCERYGFTYNNKWVQLDIPHLLLEKLNLEKGENLPASFYLEPNLLKKELICGGITIQEGEIILVSPNKIIIKDQAIQTEPNTEIEEELRKLRGELETQKQNYLDLERQKNGEITELRNQLNEKKQELVQKNAQIATLNSQKLTIDEQNAITWTQVCITAMNNALTSSNTSYLDSYQSYFNPNGVFSSSVAGGLTKYGRMYNVITNLINAWNQTRTQINSRNSLITNYQSQISSLNNELKKEQDWWDKWIDDSELSGTGNHRSGRPFIYAVEDWTSPWLEICILLNENNLEFDFTKQHKDIESFHGENFPIFRIPVPKEFYSNRTGRGHANSMMCDYTSNVKKAFKKVYQYYRDK